MFRELDHKHIDATADRLARRIAERFPDSSLSRVAVELRTVAAGTGAAVERLRRPNWLLRLGVWGLVLILLAAVVVAPVSISVNNNVPGISDLLQGIEAAVNNVVFVVIAIWFLMTVEVRPKRRLALAKLHELRSLAHVLDMHQLTKDPEHALYPKQDTESSPARTLTRFELARYLDYCSEALSIISKLAALYVQHLNDPVVLDAVNDVEQLAGGLSVRIWQKIMILNSGGGVAVPGADFLALGATYDAKSDASMETP